MTEPLHIVRDLSFAISFASEADALAQHNSLAEFLSGRLVAAMDEVLSSASTPDGSVVRIDRLDIDLGNLAGLSYYDEAEKRFRSKLGEALQRKLPALRQDAATLRQHSYRHREPEGVVSAAQNELDIVISFLETGHLPWNISVSPAVTMEEMLRRVIGNDGPALVLRLQSANHTESLARRLAWQFPDDLLNELAWCFDPSGVASGSGLGRDAKRNHWESTLLGLISERGITSDRTNGESRRAEDETDYRGLLEKALTSGDSRYIGAFWDRMVAEFPDLIAQVVRVLGLRADVRRAMARGLPEPLLRDIAEILEPSEIGFIEEMVGRPELFQEAAKEPRDSSPALESAPVVRSHLWEFTFTYLLVERGSRFNRRAYVASVVRQMAAHGNLSYGDLLGALADVLNRIESRSPLKDEMVSLLDELQQEEQAPDGVSDDADPWELLFEKALTTGDAGPLSRFWSQVAQDRREPVERIVRRLGVHSNVRRAMAQGFPDPMLRDIAEILEPSEIGFIKEVTARPELFHEAAKEPRDSSPVLASATVVKSHLWEFTFTYLLVERGSQFNRRTYLASVVRQMAAHENLLELDLVASLVQVLKKIETRSVLQKEMLSLLDEFQQEDAPPDKMSQTRDIRVELLENALTSGDGAPISPYWLDLTHNERQLVERIVRRQGIRTKVWLAIAQGFPEAMLRDIAEILEPSEIGFIDEVIRQPEPFQEAAKECGSSVTPSNARLWEATFAYLLSERGSQFNRRSYLGSVVRRMAAHDNLKYEDLLSSLAIASNRTLVPGSSKMITGSLRRENHLLLADVGGTAEPVPRQQELLEKALATGDADLIAPLWKQWMHKDRRLLARLLRSKGLRPDVRRSLAAGFPESILRDICDLLAPGSNGFIEGFLIRESAPDARTRLWEFTLTFLLSEQFGPFDRRLYAASMVRQLATRDNVKFHDLADSMAAGLEEVSPQNDEEKELFRLLREQAEEFDSPASTRLPGARELIRSCELYDLVSSCLVRGDVLPAGELVAAIDELFRKYPWQLLRIMRECRNGVPAWLADAELRRLAEVFILLRSPGKPETLDAFALRAGGILNTRRYYRRILYLLIRDLPLDFDVIEADNRTEDQDEPARLPLSPAPAEMPDELVGNALTRAPELAVDELSRLVRTLDRLLARPPLWFLQLLKEGSHGLGKALAEILPERQLARILELTAPSDWHRVQWMADVIVNACLQGQLISASAHVYRLNRKFLFDYLIQENHLPVTDAAFVATFLARLAKENGYRDAADLGTLISSELRRGTALAGGSIRRRVLDILPVTEVIRTAPLKVAPKPPPAPLPRPKKSELSVADGQDIYIRNAGQVLATPYLPRLFGMLGLLEGNVFRDADCAQRGIHLLQYMVDEAVNPPEYLLTLNKILCGLEPDAPVRRDLDLTQAEKDAVDGLLGAMIAHWSILGNTSVRGLRESFLQREGRLHRKDRGWQLLVQSRAFDMLLDKLPWGYSVIRHPWMDSTVYVEWR